MNKHDIKLPPLPQGEYRLSPDSRAPTLYDEEAMEAYARSAEPTSKDSDDFFTNDNHNLRGLNEPVEVPGDGVRCNWCGWSGIEDDLVIEIAADEPEEGPANVCPDCKRIGCLMDLGL